MKKSLFAMVAVALASVASAQPAAESKVQVANPEPRNVPELVLSVQNVNGWGVNVSVSNRSNASAIEVAVNGFRITFVNS